MIENAKLTNNVDWSFDNAKQAINDQTYLKLRFALNIIAAVGGCIAGTLAITAILEFAAVLLIPAAVFGITALACYILSDHLEELDRRELNKNGLTKEKQAKVASTRFREIATNSSRFDVETAKALDKDLSYFDSIFEIRYNPYKFENPEYAVDDAQLSETELNDLLDSVYKKEIIIHLKSLEIRTSADLKSIEEFWKDPPDEAKLSARISARYIENCYKMGRSNIDQMNKQLEAFGVKYINDYQSKAVAPIICLLDDQKLTYTFMFDELENLKNRFTLIPIEGHGFWQKTDPVCEKVVPSEDDIKQYKRLA